MADDGAGIPAWRMWVLRCTAAAAILAAVIGPLAARRPSDWLAVGVGFAAAVAAQFGVVRFRQGNRTILFGWGEAAAIIVVFLVPLGWVPLTIGLGYLLGHSLYLLRVGERWTPRRVASTANMTVAATLGALAAHAVLPAHYTETTPRVLGGLVVGALVYTVIGAILVNVVAPPTADPEPFWPLAIRTLRDKLPMVAASIAVGLVVAFIYGLAKIWLLLLPPVLVSLHQLYLYRSRDAAERRTWKQYTDIARSLHQTDERRVAIAGVKGALRLFGATAVEVWVDRLPGPVRGFRGMPATSGVNIVQLSGSGQAIAGDVAGGHGVAVSHGADPIPGPYTVRTVSMGGSRVGELRIWTARPAALGRREQSVLGPFAEALGAALHDASAQRSLQLMAQRSYRDAHQDVLTGLANRATLMREGAEVFRTLPDGGALALVVLGINRFKEVNDSLGHLAGDDLLRTTAGRLAAFIRPGDLLARVGGDEFAILSTGPPVTLEIDSELAKLVDPPAAGESAPAQASLHAAAANGEPAAVDPVEDALRRARRLADELAVPTEIAGMQVAAEVSIGVAVALSGDGDLTELLRRANIAMSRAKHGAGPVAAFDVDDKQSGEAGLERLAVVVEMREALNVDDQLRLEVQPAIDLRTKLPTSVEVLVRWDHPRRGRLAPHEFIDVVDRSELVVPFTRYVLEHALRLARDWRRAGVAAPVAVNLSPRSLADTTLPSDVATLLARYGVEPSMLVLEITEAAMVTGQEVAAVLSDLRGQGVQLALDDYGTGYSSLTFLRQVEVDEVKVDGSFVADMAGSLAAAAIIRTTVDLGRRLGIRVVAEGVETVEQVDALVDLGCRAAQGWYFARPVPAGESTALLRRLVSAAQR